MGKEGFCEENTPFLIIKLSKDIPFRRAGFLPCNVASYRSFCYHKKRGNMYENYYYKRL